ncbi:MAG TPA: isoamylase early set domain-containing protein [Gemmatimonadales bacterium]|nr:isoamylase early set domain-containing protein [Gemmatimonadales bacterium]
MTAPYHPLVKRLLDGELTLADLPPELRPEGEAALRLLEALDREPVTLSPGLEARVMHTVRRRAESPGRRAWRWLAAPREIRIRLRPWVAGAALAGALALVMLIARPPHPETGAPSAGLATAESVFVRFVLYAPEARQVGVAGTFNEWDPEATPLVRSAEAGVWTATVALPVGQHQYAFVIDGERWVADPAAPRVDDGFGRANSLIAVVPGGRAL